MHEQFTHRVFSFLKFCSPPSSCSPSFAALNDIILNLFANEPDGTWMCFICPWKHLGDRCTHFFKNNILTNWIILRTKGFIEMENNLKRKFSTASILGSAVYTVLDVKLVFLLLAACSLWWRLGCCQMAGTLMLDWSKIMKNTGWRHLGKD